MRQDADYESGQSFDRDAIIIGRFEQQYRTRINESTMWNIQGVQHQISLVVYMEKNKMKKYPGFLPDLHDNIFFRLLCCLLCGHLLRQRISHHITGGGRNLGSRGLPTFSSLAFT